ncbi:hypothetical protein ACL00X_15365 [Aeromonas diversa]|uniref:hypothetical protein n=1 Tax=Aeromonas diversa TaxID=502790 RepID=UPI00399F4032
MKTLIAALFATMALTANANETGDRPTLDLASLHQEVKSEVAEASAAVVAEAMENLRPLESSVMLTEVSSAEEPRG